MKRWNVTISREFLQDLAGLPAEVNKRANRVIDRMNDDPWTRELHPEKIQKAEAGVYSCRVDEKYRIVWKHIKPNDIIFCLVDNHDDAYARAARKSFTLQDALVTIADIVQVGAKKATYEDGLFGWKGGSSDNIGQVFIAYTDQELLDMGVPEEILPNIRALEDVNNLELFEGKLDGDVFNRLLELALGIVDRPTVSDQKLLTSLERYHGGDELHRFVDSEEFQRALSGSLEDWMLFLAPTQRHLVFRDYAGPARVKGVAGSGKTVVALHRSLQLARQLKDTEKKILFLTYGNRLPKVMEYLLKRLAGENAEVLKKIKFFTIHQWCFQFLDKNDSRPYFNDDLTKEALANAIAEVKPRFPGLTIWRKYPSFFLDEIKIAIKGRDIQSQEAYLKLERSGRGTPLQMQERKAVYEIFEAYQRGLKEKGLWDFDDYILEALRILEKNPDQTPYAGIVVDEIQDLTEATMKLIRAMIPQGKNDLFLVGDGLQKIYPGGYTLGRLGIDIVGRGSLLKKNYRNTQQVLQAAQAMMQDTRYDDLDDDASDVYEPEYSVRQGDIPELRAFDSPEIELAWIRDEIKILITEEGYKEADFVITYRWRKPYVEMIEAILGDEYALTEISNDADTYFGPRIKHSTFHSVKGLEFKVVFVVGVTDGSFVPRDDWSLRDLALEDYLAREKRLLYVAMTRARDLLYLTHSRGQPSRFLNSVPNESLIRK